MPFDGAGAEEQAGADLGIRQALAGELGDLSLLRGEVVASLGDPPADLLARGAELSISAFRERLHAHRAQLLVRDAELGARFQPATLAEQPFAVQEMRPGELGTHAGPPEMLDRRAEPPLGVGSFAEQGSGARLDAQRPVR